MSKFDFEFSRRQFLKKTSVLSTSSFIAASAPWLAAATAAAETPTSSQKLRVGVIGVGDRGKALLLHLQKVSNAKIVSVCDNYSPNLERAIKLCDGKTKAYVDHRQMLADRNLDAVVIATPLHQHAHICIDSLDAGLHTLCEKAMARTLADCKAMVDAQARSGKVLHIAHQRLFDPRYLETIKLCHAGAIGDITQIRAYWHRNNSWRRDVPEGRPELERKINWRLYKEYSAGLMTELASHQIQVANWVYGELPTQVKGSGSICYWQDGREVFDQVALIYDYPNGKKFLYDSMTNNKHYGLEEQIMGHLGTLEPEVNRRYEENPKPPAAIKQLLGDIETGIFGSIPIGGASWRPEIGSGHGGTAILPQDYDETQMQMEAFVNSAIANKPYPGLLKEGYHASIATLLGEQAMLENRTVSWPQEYQINDDERYT